MHYDDAKITNLKASLARQFSDIYDRELMKVRDIRVAKEKEEAERLSNKRS